MPNVNRYVSEGVGSSLEVSITRTDRGRLEPFELEVQPGCSMLTIVLTASDARRPAKGVAARILDPRGRRVGILDANNPVYIQTEAQPGTWTIEIIKGSPFASAELNASAINPSEFRQPSNKAPSKLRCGTCKTLLKAVVVALLFHLYHWIFTFKAVGTAGAYLSKYAPGVGAAVAFLVPKDLRDKLLDVVKDGINEPIKQLLQRICNLMRQCPPLSEARS